MRFRLSHQKRVHRLGLIRTLCPLWPLGGGDLSRCDLACAKMLGWKPALRMVGVSMAIVYALEEIGVHTGIVFGRYYFTPLMGPKLDVIPIAVFCGWVALIYIAWVVTNLLIDGSPTPTRHTSNLIIFRAVVGALVITTFDLIADPIGVASGWWVWLDGGAFYGVPIQNYVGWFIVAFFPIRSILSARERAIVRITAGAQKFSTSSSDVRLIRLVLCLSTSPAVGLISL